MTDVLGRSWQMGTIQLDSQMPQRFGLVVRGRGQPRAHAVRHPPRAARLARALHRHPDRALRRRVPGLARPGAGPRRPGRRPASRAPRRLGGPSWPRAASAPTSTPARRRSPSASGRPSSRRSRTSSSSATRRPDGRHALAAHPGRARTSPSRSGRRRSTRSRKLLRCEPCKQERPVPHLRGPRPVGGSTENR